MIVCSSALFLRQERTFMHKQRKSWHACDVFVYYSSASFPLTGVHLAADTDGTCSTFVHSYFFCVLHLDVCTGT
jgi:hypothetical protein